MQDMRPGGFSILPEGIKNLVIVNGIMWLGSVLLYEAGIVDLYRYLAMVSWNSDYFMPHQLVTHMFMHSPNNLMHVFFNMFALWMFGSTLENVWGTKRFLIYYFLTGLGAAVLHQLVSDAPVVGASGAVFGVLLAFGMLFPNTRIYIWMLFPMKAKWFVLIYGAIEFYLGFANNPGDNVAHFAHLGGMVFGYIIIKYWSRNKRSLF
jgi:membrane associated rhomboid family serine protease